MPFPMFCRGVFVWLFPCGRALRGLEGVLSDFATISLGRELVA